MKQGGERALKLIRAALPLLVLSFLCPTLASAQPQGRVDAYFGMGSARDGSSNQFVDLLGTGTSSLTSSMGGVFGTLGGGFMFKPNLGVGAEMSLRFAQGDYAGLGYRPIFFDFNGIWTPSFGTKRVMPEIQAGFGGLNLRFYGGAQNYNPYTGSSSNFVGSYNHFQLHTGFGLRVYVKQHVFVRPQFDYRWVHGLSDQFKSDSVTAYTIAVGYSF
jgi:hypothetical protein